MLQKQMKKMISEMLDNQKLELFKEEEEYARKHQFITDEMTVIENNQALRFSDAYIERSDKETEESLGVEGVDFLEQPITYLRKHINEFIYVESKWFDLIGVEAISLEVDDVFRSYDVMLGLKLQKKYEGAMKSYLQNQLIGEEARFDLMFHANEGLWDLNFDLGGLEGFNEAMTIGEAYLMIYSFLFKLVVAVENSQ
ncbi:branched-chain amino acid aminotransferase [Pseudoneobacillus sp. C159]